MTEDQENALARYLLGFAHGADPSNGGKRPLKAKLADPHWMRGRTDGALALVKARQERQAALENGEVDAE